MGGMEMEVMGRGAMMSSSCSGAKVSLGGCVAEASSVHPLVRARMRVGRINAKYSEVGSCNTVHILCMPVMCTQG